MRDMADQDMRCTPQVSGSCRGGGWRGPHQPTTAARPGRAAAAAPAWQLTQMWRLQRTRTDCCCCHPPRGCAAAPRTCSAVPSGCSYSTNARKKARMQAAMQATVGVNDLCRRAGSNQPLLAASEEVDQQQQQQQQYDPPKDCLFGVQGQWLMLCPTCMLGACRR